MGVAPLVLIGLTGGLAFSQSARVLTRESETPFLLKLAGLNPPNPLWSGRALLTTLIPESRELVIFATTADGRGEEVRFSDPDWGLLSVTALWSGEDGRIVLAGRGQTEPGEWCGFLGWISANRQDRKIIKVEGYSPQAMTVGPGGVIWAVANKTKPSVSNILLRFSPDGKLLTSTYLTIRGMGPLKDGVPTSSVNVAARTFMCASADRVGWLTRQNQYLEYDSSGTEITRLDGPKPGSPRDQQDQTLSISAANTVLISMPHNQGSGWPVRRELWSLDRVALKWGLSEPAEGAFPPNTRIYGFDGQDLMTSGFNRQLGTILVRYRLSE